MGVQILTREGQLSGGEVSSPADARTCMAVNVLKTTQ